VCVIVGVTVFVGVTVGVDVGVDVTQGLMSKQVKQSP